MFLAILLRSLKRSSLSAFRTPFGIPRTGPILNGSSSGSCRFRDLVVPSVLDTSRNDLGREFFNPVLHCASRYDRGVGYFTSGWLRVALDGMVDFAAHGGRGRWVTSPILDRDDWDAIRMGDEARVDAVLRRRLLLVVRELEGQWDRDLRSTLAWLVADSVLTFRLAVPRSKLEGGEFHDKFGIFYDLEGDALSFNGSYNDSVQGTRNYESLKVFRSWDAALAPLVSADADRFERLWENCDPNVRVYDMPEAVRESILRLRDGGRPYPAPSWAPRRVTRIGPGKPVIPEGVLLRDYQDEAINGWFSAGCRGFLEMATGTGKTITALAASVRLAAREGRLALVVAVPYQHLVDQWRTEAEAFGYRPILAYRSRNRWSAALQEQVVAFSGGNRPYLCVITTHDTFTSEPFQAAIGRLTGPTLVIADEAHHLGAEQARRALPERPEFRLALSATPDRWFDQEGTAGLRKWFGETVFSFPLEKAIGVSLTPYEYFPHLVRLSDNEMEQYQDLTRRIVRLGRTNDEPDAEALRRLLMRRAELLNKAVGKLGVLADLIDKQAEVRHTLVYCAPGQIEDVTRLLGWDKALLVHTFTAHESTVERQRLLENFAGGKLHALTAMRCLDEGVDVPATRTAYLLASTSNPREFIQRRGRVLRTWPGKSKATIHDLIAVPPDSWIPDDEVAFGFERGIVRRELQRFREFAAPALNKHEAMDVVWSIARSYHLLDF